MSFASRAKESIFGHDERGNLTVENAVIFWTNFKGEPTKFNPQGGKRTFNLALSEEVAMDLRENGWNVKERQPYDEDDDILYYTECVLNMRSQYIPRVFLCTEWNGKKSMRRLYDDNVGELDGMRYENVDVVIHPHEHGVGEYICKGYCNTLVATQAKSELFGGKYDDYMMENDSPVEEEELPF